MMTISLVDYLASQIACAYISDLRFLDPLGKIQLSHVVRKLSPSDWSLWQWNDALEYIANKQAANTVEAAYEELLASLRITR